MSGATSANNKFSIKNRFKSLDLRSPYAIVSSARKGLKTKIFYDFAAAIKMPEKTLANIINLSARTIANYYEQQKVLEPVHAEHLLKLISLYLKGEEIFGNIDEFNYWLKKPFWNSAETPMDWIVTSGGVDLLIEELDKLAQGYAV
jgi:putative toxin-antitoxin system antitoxin component (TIGR02293 family)